MSESHFVDVESVGREGFSDSPLGGHVRTPTTRRHGRSPRPCSLLVAVQRERYSGRVGVSRHGRLHPTRRFPRPLRMDRRTAAPSRVEREKRLMYSAGSITIYWGFCLLRVRGSGTGGRFLLLFGHHHGGRDPKLSPPEEMEPVVPAGHPSLRECRDKVRECISPCLISRSCRNTHPMRHPGAFGRIGNDDTFFIV